MRETRDDVTGNVKCKNDVIINMEKATDVSHQKLVFCHLIKCARQL